MYKGVKIESEDEQSSASNSSNNSDDEYFNMQRQKIK